VDGLTAVANDTGDEMLSDYAMTQSSVFESQLQRQGTSDEDGVLTQALNFLGLQPPNNYSADSIIDAFRQKLAQDPGEAVNARSMLMIIARASTDDIYQASLLMESDAKMSLDTARAILGLGGADVPWQTAAEAAKKKVRPRPLSGPCCSRFAHANPGRSWRTARALKKRRSCWMPWRQ